MIKQAALSLFLLISSFSVFSQTQELENAKRAIVNDNINVSIAYEQYVQAKNNARAKSLSLLPSLSVDLLIYDYEYAILRSIIPEPSKYFEAKAQKDLASAARINKRILEKNLVEDFERTIFLNQYQRELIISLNKEIEILEHISLRSKDAYELGAIGFMEFYRTQREILNAKTQLFNVNEIVQNQNFALKLILGVDPKSELSFEKIDLYNSSLPFTEYRDNAPAVATKYSLELVQFDSLSSAANNQKKGAQISWLSWSGVGFDYFARVSVTKSEISKIRLQKEKTKREIESQVVSQYSLIDNQNTKIEYQSKLVEFAQEEYDQALTDEENSLSTAIVTQKALLSLEYAKRDMMKLEYEREVQYIKLKRLLGVNMITNLFPELD